MYDECETKNISDFNGEKCNLYLPDIKPPHAFFRLGKNAIVLADACRRTDFERRGTIINANNFYSSDYFDNITWLGPFYCIINTPNFIALEDNKNFGAGDVVATIDTDYYWIHSSLYDSDSDSDSSEDFLENLM